MKTLMALIAGILVLGSAQARGQSLPECMTNSDRQLAQAAGLIVTSQALTQYLVGTGSDEQICFQIGQISEAFQGFKRLVKAYDKPVSMTAFQALASMEIEIPRLYGFCANPGPSFFGQVARGDRAGLIKALKASETLATQLFEIPGCK